MAGRRITESTGLGAQQIVERIVWYDEYIAGLMAELATENADTGEIRWCIADADQQRYGLEQQLWGDEHWRLGEARGEFEPKETTAKRRKGTHRKSA